MSVGTAAHANLIGGKQVIAYPGPVRRGKEWDKFEADNPASIILTGREFDVADGIMRSVRGSSLAMRVLEGEREQKREWTRLGRACQGTPDVVSDQFVTELKTGETSDPILFPFKVRRFSYHAQLAWYDESVGGRPEHYIVAVEQTPPFVVTVFKLDPKTLLAGRKLVRLWWERLMACEAANEWPGYAQSEIDLDISSPELTFAGDEPDEADAEQIIT
jgi:hypothetical protein